MPRYCRCCDQEDAASLRRLVISWRGLLESGSLLPPWLGEACFALHDQGFALRKVHRKVRIDQLPNEYRTDYEDWVTWRFTVLTRLKIAGVGRLRFRILAAAGQSWLAAHRRDERQGDSEAPAASHGREEPDRGRGKPDFACSCFFSESIAAGIPAMKDG